MYFSVYMHCAFGIELHWNLLKCMSQKFHLFMLVSAGLACESDSNRFWAHVLRSCILAFATKYWYHIRWLIENRTFFPTKKGFFPWFQEIFTINIHLVASQTGCTEISTGKGFRNISRCTFFVRHAKGKKRMFMSSNTLCKLQEINKCLNSRRHIQHRMVQ